MAADFEMPSQGGGKLHGCCWMTEEKPRAIVQIIHGIAEHIGRYDGFAQWLNGHGIAVVGEDHMGHGGSIQYGTQGWFSGGWFTAVEDSYELMKQTMARFPGIPYFLLGHSMGSFMARTLIAKHPDSGLAGCILSGTAWQLNPLLKAVMPLCDLVCRLDGEKNPSPKLQNLAFGAYNSRVEHPRTPYDWVNRSDREVDAYIADPWCGFTASAGLLRDMMTGISWIQRESTLRAMNKALPVYFIAGGDDPVGNYGKGVRKAAAAFEKAGMEQVSIKLYPLGRHEILREVNRLEVYEDILRWLSNVRFIGLNI